MVAGRVHPAVTVRGLTKRYGDELVLDDIDLDVAAGELRGLLGPNGAGKSTLLRALLGLTRPNSGTIELLGRTISDSGLGADDGVAGFVEEPAFYPYLSGAANLELLARLDDGEDLAIEDVLERVGLTRRAHDRVAGYSTGMRQRLGIAAAMLRRPSVLLLDEPTNGLDPAGAEGVAALLRELADHGTAIVLSSHLIGELEALCDSYTIIRSGRVVWDGEAGSVEREAPGAVYVMATSNDRRAMEIAAAQPGISAIASTGRELIRLVVEPASLGSFVLALGREDIAVLRLELLVSPLQALFFALTATASEASPASGGARAEMLAQAAAGR